MTSVFHFLQMVVTMLCTSFFFFPFFPRFFPSVNTKMMMAALGLTVLVLTMIKNKGAKIDKDFFVVSLFSLGVSFSSLLTMIIHNTPDDSYLGYIVSMWTWAGAAYFVTRMIKWTHGVVSVDLVCFYLAAVGTFQCILAISADFFPAIKNLLVRIMHGEGFMGVVTGRLHGLGCALDVGGGRLATILVVIVCVLPRILNRNKYVFWLLMACYGIIAFIGNMIGRTCIVGVAVSIVYLVIMMFSENFSKEVRRTILSRFGTGIIVALLVGAVLYNTNAQWRHNIRFGFEGPISLIETGHWEVKSNDMLIEGYKWPDNIHTWVFGDGYITGTSIDSYYIGDHVSYWYAGTDAGYCRFIFYFGIIGMGAFILFFVVTGMVCARRFPDFRYMFACFVLINLIIWVKVSTDVFLILAPFICVSSDEQEEYDRIRITD